MVKTGIKIFARLRPTKKPSGVSGRQKQVNRLNCLPHAPHGVLQAYEVEERQDGLSALTFTVPRSESSGAVNNKRETFSFR